MAIYTKHCEHSSAVLQTLRNLHKLHCLVIPAYVNWFLNLINPSPPLEPTT